MLLPVAPCAAVIIYSDPGRLTTPPAGKLADSGYQYEGQFEAFTGTPIAPNFFITASHIGGGVGQGFLFDGGEYSTIAEYDDPNSDLRIWQISGTFSTYAPLYTKKNEKGKAISVFGRGTDRGAAVAIKKKLRGWKWGATDSSLSWGTNKISGTENFGPDIGNVLEFAFKGSKSKPYEAALSEGDSGGGVFIKVGKTWELAGVNYSADGPFSFDTNPANKFSASLVNESGLYTFSQTNQAIALKGAKPTLSYATRISTEIPWIDSVLAGHAGADVAMNTFSNTVPEPAGAAIILIALLPGRMRRQKKSG